MHSSVRFPMTCFGGTSSVAGSFEVRRVSVSADVRDPRHDHAAEEDAISGDAVECGGGAEIDADGVARIQPARGQGVDQSVRADGQRFVDLETDGSAAFASTMIGRRP